MACKQICARGRASERCTFRGVVARASASTVGRARWRDVSRVTCAHDESARAARCCAARITAPYAASARGMGVRAHQRVICKSASPTRWRLGTFFSDGYVRVRRSRGESAPTVAPLIGRSARARARAPPVSAFNSTAPPYFSQLPVALHTDSP